MIASLRELLRLTGASPRRWVLASIGVSIILAGFDMVGVLAMLPLMQLITDGSTDGVFLQAAINIVGSDSLTALLPFVSGVVVIAFFIKSIGAVLFRWLLLGRTTRVSALAASALMRRYVLAPYASHRARRISEIYRNVNEATIQASSVLLATVSMLSDLLTTAAIVVVLALSAPVPTVFAVGLFTAFLWGSQAALRHRQVKLGEVVASTGLEAWQALIPAIEGFREARLTGSSSTFIDRFRKARLRSARARQHMGVLSDIPRYLLEIVFIMAIVGIAGILILLGEESQILPVLGVFAAASMRVLPTLARVNANVATIRTGQAGLRIMIDALDELGDDPAEGAATSAPVATFSGDITLEDVSFQFSDADEPVLSGIDLTIRENHTTAFVGSSGAGKSTLLDIVIGLLAPTTGAVRCGGHSIHDDLARWHAGLGVVPQEVFLINTTLAENIAFGRPREEVDEDRLRTATRLALLDELIDELPEGIETMLGDRGVRLSGGQRQRVGIARALYRRPSVLVLDEATSALDSATEHEISRTLGTLQGSMTVIIVAHRLSTVRNADTLIYLERGSIAATGTFEHVQQTNEQFARLVELGKLN